MAIKNYTTTVKAIKTVGEIQIILAKNNVKTIEIEYFGGEPDAVKFSIDHKHNNFRFRLPCNPHGVLSALKRDRAPRKYLTLDHARIVSWRIIKDWIDSQLALIDSGQAEIVEVFFPYLLDSNGETLYKSFEDTQLKLSDGQ